MAMREAGSSAWSPSTGLLGVRASRRASARWWPLALFALLLSCAERPPDVVVLTLDTTRADHLGVYGYPWATSPALDALAEESLVFRRAWSVAPWTLPAHASMLTGKHPVSHGAHRSPSGEARLSEVLADEFARESRANRLGEKQVTLAELLAGRGYATAAFAGGPWLSPVFGLLQGYDTRNAHVGSFEGRGADELTDAAIAWLEGLPRGRPAHLLVNYFDPHQPYRPPPGFRERVAEESVDASAAPRRPVVERYDGEIRYMDASIGRLLDALRALGRYEDALVIAVGDHGELFGEHGLYSHPPAHYEPLLRVPLLVRLPGRRDGGTDVLDPFSVVDLLPLVADEVGFALPDGVEGLRLGRRRVVLAQSFPTPSALRKWPNRFRDPLTTVIRWPWKLTESAAGERRLHRLDRDPRERSDLAGRVPEEPELVAELARAVGALVPPVAAGPPEAVPDALGDRLRELGYAE